MGLSTVATRLPAETAFSGRFGSVQPVWRIAGDVEAVLLAGMAMAPESAIFFAQPGKQRIGSGAVIDVFKLAGRQPDRSRNFFSARRLKRNASSGLQPKACIQNSGSS